MVDWKKGLQLTLMMLGSWRGMGKRFPADAHDAGFLAVDCKDNVSR